LAKNTIFLLFVFGALLAVSMSIVYFITLSGVYPVFPENYQLGNWNDAYLYTEQTTEFWKLAGVTRAAGKALTMEMVTLFFCESFLVYQIRRPNKSVIRAFLEDSSKLMYLLIGFLFALFILLMYFPGVQITLAKWGLNFMFMYLTALDWLVCAAIAGICIVSFEVVKWYCRENGIIF
jgi:hypothetical protein